MKVSTYRHRSHRRRIDWLHWQMTFHNLIIVHWDLQFLIVFGVQNSHFYCILNQVIAIAKKKGFVSENRFVLLYDWFLLKKVRCGLLSGTIYPLKINKFTQTKSFFRINLKWRPVRHNTQFRSQHAIEVKCQDWWDWLSQIKFEFAFYFNLDGSYCNELNIKIAFKSHSNRKFVIQSISENIFLKEQRKIGTSQLI